MALEPMRRSWSLKSATYSRLSIPSLTTSACTPTPPAGSGSPLPGRKYCEPGGSTTTAPKAPRSTESTSPRFKAMTMPSSRSA